MVGYLKVKPSKVPSRKTDVVDIKTQVAIAKFEQFDTSPATKRKRDNKKVRR